LAEQANIHSSDSRQWPPHFAKGGNGETRTDYAADGRMVLPLLLLCASIIRR
jgi:hypothetical protein